MLKRKKTINNLLFSFFCFFLLLFQAGLPVQAADVTYNSDEDGSVSVIVEDDVVPPVLTLEKHGIDGSVDTLLSDAVFSLSDKSGELSRKATENGAVSFSDIALAKGEEYVLKEVSAPEGYKKISSDIHFRISEMSPAVGRLEVSVWQEGTSEKQATLSAEAAGEEYTLSLTGWSEKETAGLHFNISDQAEGGHSENGLAATGGYAMFGLGLALAAVCLYILVHRKNNRDGDDDEAHT